MNDPMARVGVVDIRNEMEGLVRDEVRAIRERAVGSGVCWCPLCETDVVALSLTSLPPLYTRPGGQSWSEGLATPAKIRDAVQTAAKRVALRPKHRPGMRGPLRGEIGLVNYTYEVGLQVIGPAVAGGTCGCRDCWADTLAYALNRYPPKYGVASGGRRSLHPTYVDFMRHELAQLLTQAARIVSSQPRH